MGQPAKSERAIRFRGSFHPYRTGSAMRVDKRPIGTSGGSGRRQLWRLHFVNRGVHGGPDVGRIPESGPVSRSVSVLALRCRPGRSPGPGRLTTQVSAGNHPGQDAKPTRHRLSLLGGVGWRSPLRRRPAIGRWSPRQFVSPLCGLPRLFESLLSQESVHNRNAE